MNYSRNGPFFMLLGYACLGFVPLLVRLMAREGIPSSEITFIRFALSCLVVVVIVALGLGKLDPKNLHALLWRGLFGAGAVLCYFYALQETTAAKGTLLNYTHSIWANVFAVVLLGQTPPRGFWLLLAISVGGLWLVIDPRFTEVNWGDLLGLLSGALGAGAVLSIKHLRTSDSALTIFAAFCWVGALGALVPGLIAPLAGGEFYPGWELPSLLGWALLVGVSALAMAGQLSFTHAYGFTSIALGTLLSLLVPVLAALSGWAILGEPLTPHFVLGSILILTACFVLGVQESRQARAVLDPALRPGSEAVSVGKE